jgi:hypothetical protein
MKHAQTSSRSHALFTFQTLKLVGAALALAGLPLAQMPTPTKAAVTPPAPVVFPDPVGGAPSTGSFEAGVAANTWQVTTTFGLWTWADPNSMSGIAGGGTGGLNAGTPPVGQNVAVLGGIGTVTHPLSLNGTTPVPAGT